MDDSTFSPPLADPNGQLSHPKAKLLASILRNYDLLSAITLIAGITTAPQFQANSYRLEFLSLLVVACCDGTQKPSWKHLNHWLNRHLGVFDIASLEDPVEDTFVANILTSEGDYRILGGLWECADSSTTLLFETLTLLGGPTQRAWLKPALALLRVSDAMISRAGLRRWHIDQPELSIPMQLRV